MRPYAIGLSVSLAIVALGVLAGPGLNPPRDPIAWSVLAVTLVGSFIFVSALAGGLGGARIPRTQRLLIAVVLSTFYGTVLAAAYLQPALGMSRNRLYPVVVFCLATFAMVVSVRLVRARLDQ